MSKMVLSLATLILSQSAIAGDAGYFSRTCLSSSQRTVLTALNDYTEKAPIYTLILDGVPAVFDLSDADVQTTGDDGILVVSRKAFDAFKMEFNAETGKMKLTVFMDPRSGTIAEHNATATPFSVQLQCKDFWPNP